jgi:hypothetical protein
MITPNQAFEHDGVQYPANWLTASSSEERSAIGIQEIVEQVRPDDRFFWVDSNFDGSYTATPKDLSEVKTRIKSELKNTTNSLLAPSDWKVIRKLEREIQIDEPTAQYRAAVIAKCTEYEASIEACTSVEDLAALSFEWPR